MPRLHRRQAQRSYRSQSGNQQQVPQSAAGYHFLHTALDAHSRLAYSELLATSAKETAAAFWCEPTPGSRTAAYGAKRV